MRAHTPIAKVIVDGEASWPYFHPMVTFLDAAGNVLSTLEDERPSPWCDGSGCRGVVLNGLVPEGTKTLVLHTAPSNIGKFHVDEETHNGLTIMTGSTFVSFEPGTRKRRGVSLATGELFVRVRD